MARRLGYTAENFRCFAVSGLLERHSCPSAAISGFPSVRCCDTTRDYRKEDSAHREADQSQGQAVQVGDAVRGHDPRQPPRGIAIPPTRKRPARVKPQSPQFTVDSQQSTVDGQGPEASHGGLWLATSHSVPESRILMLDPDLIHHHQAKDQRQVNDGSEEQAPCRGVRPRQGQADAVMKETRAKHQRPEEVDQPHMTQERG